MDLKLRTIYSVPTAELNYTQIEFGVNPSISFEVMGQNVI